MFIGAYDDDFLNPDDHLDYIFIEMQLNVTENDDFTAVTEFTGIMDKVSVNMSFRVRMCREDFYGANCDVMCIAQNDDINGYYTCNGDGSIQCRPGFRNDSNNCRDGKYTDSNAIATPHQLTIWCVQDNPDHYHLYGLATQK